MKTKPFTRRDFLKTTALGLPLVAAGCGSWPRSAPRTSDFVSIRNQRFERRGRPYFFIGANFHQAGMLGAASVPGGRQRLVRELDQLRALGISNLRILAGSEGSHGLLVQPGQWNEGRLQGLDFLLAEMSKRDLTGVFYLTNYWEWSGGMASYVNWATGEPIPDPKQNANADHMNYAARFYGMAPAQELFREHIRHVLNRRNTVTGRCYRDDPTIMAWQLSNEPRPGTDTPATEANLPAFATWMDETARFIKEIAPRHLVSTGNEGTMGCLGRSGLFVQAHQTPAVDYLTLHLWVKNWGWLKEPHLGPQYEQAAVRALQHIDQHIALAHQLGKPLAMEEFGIDRDHASTDPGGPTAMRDDYYQKMFQRLLESCEAGGALQATNFWLWSGEGSREGHLSPARGDAANSRAPVDLNGVLNTDLTTLAIIRQQQSKLAKLLG